MSNAYQFDLPTHHKSIIKVIGVGGGGSNAVTHMFNQGIKDVEFVICNTDVQALKSSSVPNKLQIGVSLTEGLGAGANPEVGMNAALESKEDIREMLSHDTKMVFITAGMGGGTGTGAAPIIAKVAKELDILTVGIVTAPFAFEGRKKSQFALNGIAQLRANCDTVLVIMNDKLREVFGNLSIREAFSRADNVLNTAAKSIAEIITVTSDVNVDFEDVKTVMKNSGPAVMGSAEATGENRAIKAVKEALSSPLLNNTTIVGAKKILLSITYGDRQELTMDELTEITDYIEEQAGDEADVIFGQGVETTLEESIRVTVIATGFEVDDEEDYTPLKRKVYDLDSNKEIKKQEEVKQQEQPQKDRPSVFEFVPPTPPSRREEPQRTAEPEQEPNEEYQEPQQRTISFDLKDKYEIEDVPAEDTPSAPKEEPISMEEKRRMLDQQARERIRRLQEMSNNTHSMDPEDFKNRLDVPAYKRRNVDLKDVPHSSEKEISRYKLNDDDEILGNNKFLHDNVD